jgi:hypothetical protein
MHGLQLVVSKGHRHELRQAEAATGADGRPSKRKEAAAPSSDLLMQAGEKYY